MIFNYTTTYDFDFFLGIIFKNYMIVYLVIVLNFQFIIMRIQYIVIENLKSFKILVIDRSK